MISQDIIAAIEQVVQERVEAATDPLNAQIESYIARAKMQSGALAQKDYQLEEVKRALLLAHMALKATGAKPGDYPDHAGAIYAAQAATESQLPPRDRSILIVTTKTRVAAVFSNVEDAKEHLQKFKPYEGAELYGKL